MDKYEQGQAKRGWDKKTEILAEEVQMEESNLDDPWLLNFYLKEIEVIFIIIWKVLKNGNLFINKKLFCNYTAGALLPLLYNRKIIFHRSV